jgi:hypothetical protein
MSIKHLSFDNRIELYHYTSKERLQLILKEGITKGDVPITPDKGFNAPWLTEDMDWGTQNWTTGAVYNKMAVRLTVNISTADPLLCKWSKVAEEYKMDKKWFRALNKGNNSDKWFIYKGIISPEMISSIEYNPALLVEIS